MPDINNIKAMAEMFEVSIDYLLDDGSSLDMSVTRESIDLSSYGYDRAGMAGKKFTVPVAEKFIMLRLFAAICFSHVYCSSTHVSILQIIYGQMA